MHLSSSAWICSPWPATVCSLQWAAAAGAEGIQAPSSIQGAEGTRILFTSAECSIVLAPGGKQTAASEKLGADGSGPESSTVNCSSSWRKRNIDLKIWSNNKTMMWGKLNSTGKCQMQWVWKLISNAAEPPLFCRQGIGTRTGTDFESLQNVNFKKLFGKSYLTVDNQTPILPVSLGSSCFTVVNCF